MFAERMKIAALATAAIVLTSGMALAQKKYDSGASERAFEQSMATRADQVLLDLTVAGALRPPTTRELQFALKLIW